MLCTARISPCRITTMRSAIANTFGRSWQTMMTLRFADLNSVMYSSTSAVCVTDSDAVGSSSTTRLGSLSSVRAIATVCRCPPEREDMLWLARTGVDSVLSTSRALSYMPMSSRAAMPRRSSCPRKIFAETSRFSQNSGCWNADAMPSSAAFAIPSIRTCLPHIVMLPESGCSSPAMTCTNVDLPAPLSPTIATICRLRTARLTSRNASTFPYFFVTPCSSINVD